MVEMVTHKKNVKSIIRCISLCIVALFIMSIAINRNVITIYADDDKSYVTDNADILQSDEIEKLEKMCAKASQNCKTDIFIITLTDNLTEFELDTYLRNMMSTDGFGYNDTYLTDAPDAIGFAIDMTSRKYRISSSGNSMSDISQSAMDNMVSGVQEYLSDGDYYTACVKFINSVQRNMNTSIIYKLTRNLTTKLFISIGVATAAVVIMMFNAKSKVTVDSTTYTKDHRFNVNARQDIFVNTTVVTHHIDRSDHSSSSDGGGGGSSGGGNYGGGGGSF